MQFWNHYVAGVTDIWLVLLVSIGLFVLVSVQLWRSWASQSRTMRRMGRLANDESGATYMLPLVLVMPFYILLIAMIVECTLMLTQKIGSVGAAYSAARAAAVWLPYETAMPKEAPDYTPLQNRQAMVRLAAARAMWPFASGSKAHASSEPLGEFIEATAQQQIDVFQAYSGDSQFDKEYLKRKFAYAYNASTFEIVYLDPVTMAPTDNPAFNAKIQLTLRYEAPIHTYGVGRLFGEKSQVGSYYVRPVETTVMMENEGVKSILPSNARLGTKPGKSLGIRYYSLSSMNMPISAVSTRNTNSLPPSKYPTTKPPEVITINGIQVPIYTVPSGMGVLGGAYNAGAVYLTENSDLINRENELQTARDDARDGEMNNVFHDERRDVSEDAPQLTRLEVEIRSDQASLREVDRQATFYDPMNTVRRPYVDRINWMTAANSLIVQGRYDEARALPASANYTSYLENAIESDMRLRIAK